MVSSTDTKPDLRTEALSVMNRATGIESLFDGFLELLHTNLELTAATIRLRTAEDRLDLIAATGLGSNLVESEQTVSCLPTTKNEGHVKVPGKPMEFPLSGASIGDVLTIPVYSRHARDLIGYIDLYRPGNPLSESRGITERLEDLALELGAAIERIRDTEATVRSSILEERNRIAQELHDSLAQSLASLRFQIRVLDETLHHGNESALWSELERIEGSMDEAHTELRELIANFRAPVGEKSLAEGVSRLVERFRSETGIHIFLQQEWSNQSLPAETESQVYRIIQESLANIRKHSGAKHVRVMMRNDQSGFNLVLIEDDGTGITTPADDSPGEHVGLSIMEERAKRIGAHLRIESEPGEGTRIQLQFNTQNNERRPAQ